MPDTPATIAPSDADLSGRRLGAYHILRRLGRGGMADVYLAEQASLSRQVAIKVLKSSLASDAAYVRRFKNEAEAVAKLSHANIVQIYDISCIDGIHFIAQEYVKGQNLRQLLNRNSSIDAKLALHIIRQVAAALNRAGQQGIIHRDIKPENIMLAATGEVKVTDFGLARVIQQSGELNLTQVGITMGTPLYMSPEQVEGKAVDQRSDLYSFGVTIYHLLAGRPPFSGETPLSIAVQHLKTEPDPLSELRPDLPPGICRIVHKLMAKAPEQRYASAADLLRELRTLQPADGDDGFAHDSLAAIDIELNGQEYVGVQATQQLQALMEKTHTIALRTRQRHWKRAAIALTGAALVGGALAYANRPRDLLAPPKNQTRSSIAKLDNVKEQYLFAIRSPVQSEAAYKAVMEYFPPESGGGENFIYSLRAKQQLARLYRDQGEPAKAAEIYDEFINLDPSETEFRAIGYLGLANIESAAGNREAAVTQLSNASKLVTKLSRERQGDLLRTLDEPLRAEWEQRIRELGAP